MASSALTSVARHRAGARDLDVDAALTRGFDIAVSALALLFLAPLFLLIALLMKATDRGPVLFAQQRIGRDGRMFRCYKFRSMVIDADRRLADHLASNAEARAEWARDHKLRNDPRITQLGRFLRKSSIDELPQLLNVLRGDMALVGPRPIVQAEAVRYGRYFADYCAVRPGLTGLWQVSGRNNVSYRRRVALDTCYARSRSFAFDLKIIGKTVPAVLMASGSY